MVALAWCPAVAIAWEGVEAGQLGRVSIVRTEGEPKGTIIVFSDPRGNSTDLQQAVRALADAGYEVAVVDSAHYLAAINRGSEDCHPIQDDVSALIRLIAQQGAATAGGPPILVGSGAGGAIAYAALAQAGPGDFAGAIGFEFSPDVPGRVPFCAPVTIERSANGYRYPPVVQTQGWWRMATKTPDNSALRPYAKGDPARLVVLRGYDDLGSAVLGIVSGEARPAAPGSMTIADLPLVTLPTRTPGSVMAIFYSGDGGWRDLDKEIGKNLQAFGIPVVGFDALRFFWDRRTPEEAANSLAVAIGHFSRAWNTPDVLLVGYSFGADVLPFAVNRLPEAERWKIRQISLLAPGTAADFEIHVSGWLGGSPHSDALPLAPELQRLDPRLLQCFYGADDKDETACVLLSHAEVIETEGGHHFNGDYAALTRRIVDGLVRRGSLPAN
jgi:type IV secretory pathway VirJ component